MRKIKTWRKTAFVILATLSGVVIASLVDGYGSEVSMMVVLWLAGSIYGLSTLLVLPPVFGQQIALKKKLYFGSMWFFSSVASYMAAAQWAWAFAIDKNSHLVPMLVGVSGLLGAGILTAVYTYIAFSMGFALRGWLLFFIPVAGGVVTYSVFGFIDEPLYFIYTIWQFVISLLLVMLIKPKSLRLES